MDGDRIERICLVLEMHGGIRGSGLKRRQGRPARSVDNRASLGDSCATPKRALSNRGSSQIFGEVRSATDSPGQQPARLSVLRGSLDRRRLQSTVVVGGCVAVPMPVRLSHRKLCVLFGTTRSTASRNSARLEGHRGDERAKIASSASPGDPAAPPPPPPPAAAAAADRNPGG